MDNQQKLEYIQKLSEEDLRKRVLIPLFKMMGFRDVTDYHGVLEFGKDLIFYEEDSFGYRIYSGVQVKAVDIKSGNIFKVLEQAKQCLDIPFMDTADGKRKKIERCLIVTSGKITTNAMYAIRGELERDNLGRLVRLIDGNKLVSLIDEYLPSYFWVDYDYFAKYFNAMKSEFKRITDISMLGRIEPVPLEQIFVSLKLIEKVTGREIPVEKENEKEPEKKKPQKPELVEERIKRDQIFDSEEVVKRFNRIVIVGVPGSGKTTLIKHLALKSCMENLNNQERVTVPVPVTLRELLDSGQELREYINSVFEKFDFPKAKKFIEKDLKSGKCRLLLDGFDELATADRQKKVTELIGEFMAKYSRNQIIVTSRVAGYHDELKGFTKLELMEFDDMQIEQFIKNWFGDTTRADSMYNAIKENEKIKAIARNPLMIAIIAIIYEEDKKLPQRRVDLYERCVDVLLSRWDVQRRIKNRYSSDVKKFILKKLALHFHKQEKRVLDEVEIIKEMMKYFPDVDLKRGDAKPFLDELWARNYLFRQQSMTSYDFLHLSFQEYFTALELEKNNDYKTLIENIDNPWWEEIILLFAGMKEDASSLIKTIRGVVKEDIFYSNLLLFGKCIADANKTKKKVRDQITRDLWSLYKTAEFPALREKAIGVLAIIKPDNIIDSLINDLAAKESDVRRSAAYALGRIGSEKAIEPLLNALTTDTDIDVRRRAVYALEGIGSEKAIEPLLNALTTDTDSKVRWSAVDALEGIGSEKAIEPLLNALTTDTDSNVQERAADALGGIGSEKAIEPLLNALTTDTESDVRRRAADALGGIGSEKAIEPLLNALTTDTDSYVRLRAADALGRIGDNRAVEPLKRVLKDGGEIFVGKVKDEAFSALEQISRRIHKRIPLEPQ